MADKRYFAKVDVGYFDNPKVAPLMDDRPRVVMLHLRAILYCRQHLTDGRFPIRQVARLACATACGSQCESHSGSQCDFCEGVDAGLFVRIDDRTAEVHDYLEHQESARQVNRRSDAGKVAAAARWGCESHANRIADRNANRSANRNAEERRGEEREAGGRKRPARPLPDGWQPTDTHRQRAKDRGIDLDREVETFKAHAEANDRRLVDWNAGFTQWLSKARPSPAHSEARAKEAGHIWSFLNE